MKTITVCFEKYADLRCTLLTDGSFCFTLNQVVGLLVLSVVLQAFKEYVYSTFCINIYFVPIREQDGFILTD